MHVLKKDYENLNRTGKKNMHFTMETLLIKIKKKRPYRNQPLSLHYMSAVLRIARDGHLRANTLVNLRVGFLFQFQLIWFVVER